MEYKLNIISLYYLLIGADGAVNERELLLGKKMITAEGIAENVFEDQLVLLKSKDAKNLYRECLSTLKRLDKVLQIKSIAWLCVMANSDGFMDKAEWELIYKLYHTELRLSLDEVMKVQKDLNKIIHGKAYQSLGVRV